VTHDVEYEIRADGMELHQIGVAHTAAFDVKNHLTRAGGGILLLHELRRLIELNKLPSLHRFSNPLFALSATKLSSSENRPQCERPLFPGTAMYRTTKMFGCPLPAMAAAGFGRIT
jgi:hypothetical protein